MIDSSATPLICLSFNLLDMEIAPRLPVLAGQAAVPDGQHS
jgi:hypothetical protein